MSENEDKETHILVSHNGPYLVYNLKRLKNSKGEVLETTEVTELCRCGGSKNKPFCDDTHKEIGFRDPKN
jgi:CDGSH-type Zn-finger protein